MLVIHGTRRKVKRIKQLGTQVCENCGHTIDAELARESGYHHIYYIPVFPYSGYKFILCPNCGVSKKLTGAEYKELKKS